MLEGKRPVGDTRRMIDKKRVTLEYFDPRITEFEDIEACGSQCSSCGDCRDCGVCVAVCPQNAISRAEKGNGEYEYTVDESRCIACGFCAEPVHAEYGIWQRMNQLHKTEKTLRVL